MFFTFNRICYYLNLRLKYSFFIRKNIHKNVLKIIPYLGTYLESCVGNTAVYWNQEGSVLYQNLRKTWTKP